MKQRITYEQLLQLAPKQQEKLTELWNPEMGDYVVIDNLVFILFNDDDFKSLDKSKAVPLLSIGKLIELIEENESLLLACTTMTATARLRKKSILIDIVDALWEDVKDILK